MVVANYTRSIQISGVSNDSDGNELYIPLDILTAAGATDYSQIKVEAADVGDVQGLWSQIETLGLQTQSPVDTIDQINHVFQFFNIVLVGFGAIGMAVAILGMFNTLTISLLERTREIGLIRDAVVAGVGSDTIYGDDRASCGTDTS